jgi:hypothetical protein
MNFEVYFPVLLLLLAESAAASRYPMKEQKRNFQFVSDYSFFPYRNTNKKRIQQQVIPAGVFPCCVLCQILLHN